MGPLGTTHREKKRPKCCSPNGPPGGMTHREKKGEKVGFGHNSVKNAIFLEFLFGIESLQHKLSIDGLTWEWLSKLGSE